MAIYRNVQGNNNQGKATGAIKDIHQQREESSRARGILASRAKSESFAYKGGQSRSTGHKEGGGEPLRGLKTKRQHSQQITG